MNKTHVSRLLYACANGRKRVLTLNMSNVNLLVHFHTVLLEQIDMK